MVREAADILMTKFSPSVKELISTIKDADATLAAAGLKKDIIADACFWGSAFNLYFGTFSGNLSVGDSCDYR